MNHLIPEWNFEADLPISNHKKPMGEDNELVELLWQNGQVVLHSQTHRKHGANQSESRQVQQYEQPTTIRGSLSYGNSTSLIHDDETVSWIHYPIEDSFEKELCSDFFSGLPTTNAVEADKHDRQSEKERFVKSAASTAMNVIANPQELNVNSVVPAFPRNPTPPPKFQIDTAFQSKKLGNLVEDISSSQFSAPFKGHMGGSSNGQFEGKGSGSMTRESSVMTFGSSHCGSNQIRNDVDFSRASSDGIGTNNCLSAGSLRDNVQKEVSNSDIGKNETLEPAVTSSDGSGSSFGRTCKESTGVGSQKRKNIDGEETECQSEAVELELAAGNKLSQRAKPPRRSRAAEVHNLSERRRRDRINKKMRALQELIPHCNKTDKASMLDEAIEYLKSLQLQLQVSQVMWMGSGMTPMMFPGVQHYMPRMAMGMSLPTMSPINNSMHLPRIPVGDHSAAMAPPQNQAVICQTQVPNPVIRFQNHLQNSTFPEQYARYMGFHHMQAASQAMNMFGYGSQTVQQGKMTSQPGSDCRPSAGGASANGDASLQ